MKALFLPIELDNAAKMAIQFFFSGLFVLDVTSSLQCYNCKSSTRDVKPVCETRFWKQMDREEWKSLIIDCPHTQELCIIQWHQLQDVNGSRYRNTTRTCIARQHENTGLRLNAGCIVEQNLTTCFCTEDLCNACPSRSTATCFVFWLHLAIAFATWGG